VSRARRYGESVDPGVELTNGKGEAIDLAESKTRITRIPAGEIGSAYSGETLFTRFDDGRFFETRDLRTDDFEQMLRLDGKAKTLEQVLTLPLRSAEHSIEPAANDNGEAEFCREALERPANAGGMTTPLELVIGQMTSACLYRRAYFEKVFRVEEGRVNYGKLAFRPARTCSLLRDKDDYSFKGFRQRFLKDTSFVTVDIPPDKAFVYIHGQHRDPLNGISDLETAFSIFESKQKVRFLWYSFLENQTIPKGIAKHSTTDTTEQKDFAEKVATLKGGGVVGIGPDQDVSPYESSGRGAETFKQAMDYLSAEMAGSVLAGFTELTSSDRTGSYALSKDQSDLFLRSRQAILSEMGAALTSWVLADLCLWNFGVGAAVPTFKFQQLTEGEVEKPLQLLQALATSAATNPALPAEFIELLTVKVAALLGMDTGAVHAAITKGNEGKGPAGQLHTGIANAAQLLQQAGITSGAPTAA
jgi:glutaredoxin-related protein